MNKDVGTLIGSSSTMGSVDEMDTDIDDVGWGEFLRVRILLDLTKPLSRGRFLKLQGKSIWVDFQYERLPRYCFHCGIINHGKEGCSKREATHSQGGEPQYGPWLRVPSPTRRFNADGNWHGWPHDHASRSYKAASSGGGGSSKPRGPPYMVKKSGGAWRWEAKKPARGRNVTESEDGIFGFLGGYHGNLNEEINAFPKEVCRESMAENSEEEIMGNNEDLTSSAKIFGEENIGTTVGGSSPFMNESPNGFHTSSPPGRKGDHVYGIKEVQQKIDGSVDVEEVGLSQARGSGNGPVDLGKSSHSPTVRMGPNIRREVVDHL